MIQLTPYQRYELLAKAQADWAAREQGFPKHTRQTWDKGTPLARQYALLAAAAKLGFL